jgi:ubiquitin C-terminal hydrolase
MANNADFEDYYEEPVEEAKGSEYTGLSNQGATCYMNSLLQTLFMTPEFRDKLYSWQYDQDRHGEVQDCIPLQLQLLFAKLHTAKGLCAKTTGLTKSFGWDSRESFEQHDVQEFCRVLFDAIERSVRDTAQASMITDLYEGVLHDYVKCLNCGTESRREDKFLDVSLTVKNVFDKVYNDSVEKALENYLRAEFLSGDNRYMCEVCSSKQDALKGLKFKQLPSILALQLKRFDLDYTTFQRVKLNDEVRFPLVLNMNPYIREGLTRLESYEAPEEQAEAEGSRTFVPDDLDSRTLTAYKYTAYDAILADQEKLSIKMDDVVHDRFVEAEQRKKREEHNRCIEKYLKEGPDVYELFSVMIHSGSAFGGHYYAYIRSFERGGWHCFNDSSVRPISEDELKRVYGSNVKAAAGNYNGGSSSANAYMLMYRRVDPSNINEVLESRIPEFCRELILRDIEQDSVKARERTEKLSVLTVKVYYKGYETALEVKKDETFLELKEKAIKALGYALESENVRVRGYSLYYDSLLDIYKDAELIGHAGVSSYKTFGLEVKQSGDDFEEFDPDSIVLKVIMWDDSIETAPRLSIQQRITDARRLTIKKSSTVKELMQRIEEKFGLPADSMLILKKGYSTSPSATETLSAPGFLYCPMSYARVYEGTVLFVETAGSSLSKWKQEIEADSRRYTIKFNHPDEPLNAFGQADYRHSVVVDNTQTLQELKDLIAAKLQMETDTFLIKRGNKYGQEVKDLTAKVLTANLINNSIIYCEKGAPSLTFDFRLLICFASIAGSDVKPDGISYKILELVETPLNAKETVMQAKVKICRRLNAMYPSMALVPNRVCLRERNSERLCRVLRNQDLLEMYTLYEKKNLALQTLDADELELAPSQMIVVVRRWSPSTWELSPSCEVVIDKHSTVEAFGKTLAEKYQIEESDLEVCKITYTWNFMRTDLVKEHWQRTSRIFTTLTQSPWYLTIDGILFIIKDRSEPLRELTEGERRKFTLSTPTAGTSSYTYTRPKEASVKITVKSSGRTEESKAEETKTEESTETEGSPSIGSS